MVCGRGTSRDPVSRCLTIAISLTGAPRMLLDLDHPTEAALEKLRRLATSAACGAASFAAHAVDVLGGETVGLRYFRQFRCTLERMATIKRRTRAQLPASGFRYRLERGQKSIKGVNGPPV